MQIQLRTLTHSPNASAFTFAPKLDELYARDDEKAVRIIAVFSRNAYLRLLRWRDSRAIYDGVKALRQSNAESRSTLDAQVRINMRYLDKFYVFAFWHLRQAFKDIFDARPSDWKAIAIIGSVQIGLVMALLCLIAIVLQHRVWLPPSGPARLICALGIGLVVTAANNRALLFQSRWSRYAHEFEAYSTTRRIVLISAVWFSIFFAASVMLFAASAASKIHS